VATISSPGIGSNLDVNGIVSQLMSVEQQPLLSLAKKEASYQAKLSAIGSLKGALSSFQAAAKALSDIGKFQATKATVGDGAVASATGSGSATPGSYALEVSKLAQAQKLVSAGQASSSDPIGTGTLTFDFGTIAGGSFDSASGKYTGATFTSSGSGVKTVEIKSGGNSLTGIRDAINAANIGVTAAIVNDGGASPYRLVLTETSTGKASSMKISVAGDAGLQALLNHDPGAAAAGQALTETVTAQNAEFKIDGIAVSKSSNSISDVIPGVTLSLAKTNAGSPTTVSVTRDTSAVTGAVGQFVFAYNQINQTLTGLSAYNSSSKQGAVLNGDATVRSIQNQVRGVLNNPVAGGASAFNVLAQIGVTLQKDGTMAVDNDKLQKAMTEKFTDIAGLFAATGKASDSLVSYAGASAKTVPGSYAVNVTQLATRGQVVGQTPVGQLAIDGSNDTLEVKLNGVTVTVKLAQKTYADEAALAAEIQSKINGAKEFSDAGLTVTATQNGGVLTLVSANYGADSSVSITGGSGKANLFGATPIVTDGKNVVGTINGVAATGAGQFLTGAAGSDAEGLRLQVTGTATGSRGTISYSKGYAYQFDKLIDTLLADDGPIAARTDGLNETLKNIGKQKDALNLRLTDIEKRYRAQFTALDQLLGSMTKTSSFLQQQLANLPKIE
jgi:flagellar hook-associated protein 2